jgi:hypothetical protein
VFVLVSRSYGGQRYLKIAHAVRRQGRICRRHIECLGRYEEKSFLSYREIVGDWKLLGRWSAVVAELCPEAPLFVKMRGRRETLERNARQDPLAKSCAQPPAGGP